jgi:hypothetical protein
MYKLAILHTAAHLFAGSHGEHGLYCEHTLQTFGKKFPGGRDKAAMLARLHAAIPKLAGPADGGWEERFGAEANWMETPSSSSQVHYGRG